jgi:glycyl-tRNA synthetase
VAGALLALADRFDLLAGLFGIGAHPTGSSDPFGLRRAALGAVSVLRAFPQLREITLSGALSAAREQLVDAGVDVPEETVEVAREFALRRYEQQLLDAGNDHRFVNAVLPLADSPARADETLVELTGLAERASFAELVAALQRVRRIVPAETSADYDRAALGEPAELALDKALGEVRAVLGDLPVGLAAFAGAGTALTGPVNTFFDEVLVMAEEPDVRRARLGLLASIRDLAAPVLDWQALGTALG